MTDKIFLVGNKDEWGAYEANINNIDALPIRNLPMSYFPFYYNESESSVEKMKRLVPLIENYTKVDNENKVDAAPYSIDTEKLFSLLTNLEEPYQPFNNNNIKHIKYVVIVMWVIIGFFVLKIIYYQLNQRYIYFIIFMIFLLLVGATLWALIVTSKSF